jgi:hypothetical protein
MAIQGMHRGGGYVAAQYAPSVRYVKAEQDCGLQGCLQAVCHAISALVSCLFKALSCCFGEGKSDKITKQDVIDLTPPPLSQRRVIDVTPIPRSPDLVPFQPFYVEGKEFHRELFVKVCFDCGMETTTLRLLLVCKGWFGVVYKTCVEQLQNRTSLTMREIFVCAKIVGKNPNDWDSVFVHCKQLEALNFSEAFPPVNNVVDMLRTQHRQGTKIVPQCMSGAGVDTSKSVFDALKEEELKCLDKQLTRRSDVLSIINTALEQCPSFKSLDLSMCRGMCWDKTYLKKENENGMRLGPVSIRHLHAGQDPPELGRIYAWRYSLDTLEFLLRGLSHNKEYSQLTHLSLAYSCKLDDFDEVIENHLENLPNLVSLDLSGIKSRGKIYMNIEKFCKGLCRLKITESEFTGTRREFIRSKLPNLEITVCDSESSVRGSFFF